MHKPFLCPYCLQAEVEHVTANEPWSTEHWQCPDCDSTYIIDHDPIDTFYEQYPELSKSSLFSREDIRFGYETCCDLLKQGYSIEDINSGTTSFMTDFIEELRSSKTKEKSNMKKLAVLSTKNTKVKHCVDEEGGETYCGFPYHKSELYQEDNVEYIPMCGNCVRTDLYQEDSQEEQDTTNDKKVKTERISFVEFSFDGEKHICDPLSDNRTVCDISIFPGDDLNPSEDIPVCKTCEYLWGGLDDVETEEDTDTVESKYTPGLVQFISSDPNATKKMAQNCAHIYEHEEDSMCLCGYDIKEETDNFLPDPALPVCFDCLRKAEELNIVDDCLTAALEGRDIIKADMIRYYDMNRDNVEAIQFRSYTREASESCIHLYKKSSPFSTLCHENITPMDVVDPEKGKPVCYKCIEAAEKEGLDISPYDELPQVDPDETVVRVWDDDKEITLVKDTELVSKITVHLSNDALYTYTLSYPMTIKNIMKMLPKGETPVIQ